MDKMSINTVQSTVYRVQSKKQVDKLTREQGSKSKQSIQSKQSGRLKTQ